MYKKSGEYKVYNVTMNKNWQDDTCKNVEIKVKKWPNAGELRGMLNLPKMIIKLTEVKFRRSSNF